VQVASPTGESVGARRARVGDILADPTGADLVVLPELWVPECLAFSSYAERAEPLSVTPSQLRETGLAGWAVTCTWAVLERDEQGRLFNTAVRIGPNGELPTRPPTRSSDCKQSCDTPATASRRSSGGRPRL
jgi:hypothetical protein